MSSDVSQINALLNEIQSFLRDKLKVSHLRINVMTPQPAKLMMIAHTDGFDSEEVKITLSKGQGCSGKAWNTKAPEITDLGKDVHWMSSEDQGRVKKGLRVILAMPLFDPDVPNQKKVIGTITFDSTENIFEPLQNALPSLIPYVQRMSECVKKSGL